MSSQAMYEPFLKFAIPATLTNVAALMRGVKLPDGQGVNLATIVLAVSASGKSEAHKRAAGVITDVQHGINAPLMNRRS